MRANRLLTACAILLGAGFGYPDGGAHAQEYEEYPLEARVWMDRGHEPVLQRGESVRLYYRVSEDAFVAIFHIDTNGTVRMVFPTSPQENHFARGGRDYRVLFPGSNYWYVNEDPGLGYFFAVASPEPFDLSDLRYSHYDGGWDLSFVGRHVYRDPYLAMDDYVATLIPDWEYIPYGLDFTTYHVEQRYEYPRFMCYDCHGFRPYNVWNPYHYSCASFRVVVYNDPYYYPVNRYRGSRVVYVQPRRGVAHFAFKERAAGEPGTPQVVYRTSPTGSQPGVAGTENRRAQPRSTVSTPGASTSSGSGVARREQPQSSGGSAGTAGTERRRPSGGSVTRLTPPTSSTGTSRRGTPETVPLTAPRPGATGGARKLTDPPRTGGSPPGSAANRPVLERRPSGGSSATSRTPPATTRTPPARPSAKVRKGGGATGGGSAIRPGGSGAGTSGSGVLRGGSSSRTTRPTVRSGGTGGGTTRPTAGSGRATTRNPAVRGGGTTRPAVRSGGTSRPTVRSSGGTSRPTVRSSGGTSRPTVRSSGGTSRPTVRKSGGSTGRSSATTRKPPVRKKRSGGGGG